MWARIRDPRTIGGASLAAAGVGLVLLALVLACAGLRAPASLALWDRLALRPLSDAERASLERCDEEPSWWTWLRVIEQDADVPCGEGWVVDRVAPKVGGTRARWLAERARDATAPAGLRMRAATILAVAGEPPPVEAAFLLPSLPDHRRTAWAQAARSPGIALQLGPAGRAFGLAAELADGAAPLDDEALGALAFLSRLDDPSADAAVRAVGTRALDADPQLPERVAARRDRGGGLSGIPRDWVPVLLAHRGCEPRCAPMWLELLVRERTRQALDRAQPLPADLPGDPALAELLSLAGAPPDERRALAWAVRALADWVTAAPDPAERLRLLAAQPVADGVDPLASAWTGATTPFVGALVASAVGRQAGVPVAVRARPGEVWVGIAGDRWAIRSCGPVGPEPPPEDWPTAAVRAAALLEHAAAAADPARALRLATAARQLDPLVGGPLTERLTATFPPELAAGHRIGSALRPAPTPPTGAEEARRAVGAARPGCGELAHAR